MPIEYQVDARTGLVCSRAFGVLASSELLAHIRGLAEDPTVPMPLHEIWDGGELERFDAWGADVRGFINTATTLGPKFGRARLAIVAPGTLLFGLGRMAQLLADLTPFRIGVFRARDEAVAWMDARLSERDAARAADAGE